MPLRHLRPQAAERAAHLHRKGFRFRPDIDARACRRDAVVAPPLRQKRALTR
jgi:hypothetical protein